MIKLSLKLRYFDTQISQDKILSRKRKYGSKKNFVREIHGTELPFKTRSLLIFFKSAVLSAENSPPARDPCKDCIRRYTRIRSQHPAITAHWNAAAATRH